MQKNSKPTPVTTKKGGGYGKGKMSHKPSVTHKGASQQSGY